MFLPFGFTQSSFLCAVGIDEDQYHLWYVDHKVFIEVYNEDFTTATNFTIEVYGGVGILDYTNKGYTKSIAGELDLFSKTISVDPGTIYSEIIYFETNNVEERAIKSHSGTIKVKDPNGNYIEPFGGSQISHNNNNPTDPDPHFFYQFTDPEDFPAWTHTNLLVGSLENPSFINTPGVSQHKYLIPGIYPDVKCPDDDFDQVQWLIWGHVYVEVNNNGGWYGCGVGPNDNEYLIGSNSYYPRRHWIKLINDESELRIQGNTILKGRGITISSGRDYDPITNQNVQFMARGIIVEAGSTLDLENTLIEDQMTAITLIGDATLNLTDCFLTDNLVGIKVLPGENGEKAIINLNNVYFSGTGQLKTSPENRNYPFAHIKVEEDAEVEINVMNVNSNGTRNVFMFQGEYGIYSEGKSVTINGGDIDYSMEYFHPTGLSKSFWALFPEEDLGLPHFVGVPIVENPIHGTGIYSTSENEVITSLKIEPNPTKNLTITNATKGIHVETGLVKIDGVNILQSQEEGILFENGNLNINNSNILEAERGIVGINADVRISSTEIEDIIEEGVHCYSGVERLLYLGNSKVIASKIGVKSSINTILQYSEITDATNFGVHFLGSHKFMHSLYTDIISQGTGIRTGPLTNSTIDIHHSDIKAENRGLDMFGVSNSNVKFYNNDVETKWQGVRSTIGSGSYLIVGSNEFKSYSSGSNFNTSAGIFNDSRHQLWIDDNEIDLNGAKYGVKLIASSYSQTSRNYIDFRGTVDVQYGDGIGISINGGVDNYLNCNTIYQQLVGNNISTQGIVVQKSQFNTYIDNNIYQTPVSMQFYGDNIDAIVRRNYFGGYRKGLIYGQTFIDPFTNEIIKIPAFTGEQSFTGNQWFWPNTSTTGGYNGAVFHGSDIQAGQNRYIVNPTHNPEPNGLSKPEYIIPGGNDWFKSDPMSLNDVRSTYFCPQSPGGMRIHGAEAQVNFIKMVADSVDFGYYDEEIKANYFRIFYKELLKGNVNFTYTSNQINNRLDQKNLNRDLVDVQFLIESALTGEVLDSSEFNTLIGKMDDLSVEIEGYMTIPDTAYATLETKMSAILVLFEALQSQNDTVDFTVLESALTSLPNRQSYTEAESALHYVLLGQVRLMKGDTSAYNPMKSNIMDIAMTCPYEFGEAVYIARSLVGEDYPLSYEDFSMCEPENNQPLKKDNPFVSNSVVYPIPSSGNLTVELADGSERIEVLSNEGKLMRVIETGEGGKMEMNLPDGGIYYLQIYHQDGNVENKKVIIVK